MLKRGYKLIVCVVIVASLFIGFGSAFASAAEPAWLIQLKATIAATMLAADLVLNPVGIVLDSPIAQAVDPLGQLPWVETLPEYLDRSVIKVVPDAVIIDGVPYSEVWLGPEATDKLRLKGLDFATAYNILNEQENISYAEGLGTVEGVPIYLVNGVRRSAAYNVTVGDSHSDTTTNQIGNWYVRVFHEWSPASTSFGGQANTTGEFGTSWSSLYENYPSPIYISMDTRYNPRRYKWTTVNGNDAFGSFSTAFVNAPFSFDYTSGIIDAPLAEEDGLLLRIPSTYTDPDNPQYNYDIHDLINISPTIVNPGGHEINIDPDLNPDFQTDVDLGNGVGDLIRIIIQLLDLLDNVDIEFAPEPGDPAVDPDPAIPDTPVGEQDGTWLDELLRWIKNAIDTISQTIIDAKDVIQNEIQDLSQTISELPEQILEDIETGPSKVFRKAIDVLKSLFMPLLLPIKAMMGLWHYVVEWIGSVTSPFTWIFGIMSSANYNMVLPIYAMLAGSICIAIYKALGR